MPLVKQVISDFESRSNCLSMVSSVYPDEETHINTGNAPAGKKVALTSSAQAHDDNKASIRQPSSEPESLKNKCDSIIAAGAEGPFTDAMAIQPDAHQALEIAAVGLLAAGCFINMLKKLGLVEMIVPAVTPVTAVTPPAVKIAQNVAKEVSKIVTNGVVQFFYEEAFPFLFRLLVKMIWSKAIKFR